MDSDPYEGIEMPTPPKGYRLARWGETRDSCDCQFFARGLGEWVYWTNITAYHWTRFSKMPECAIFAIPKPRVTIPLEVNNASQRP